MRLLRWGEVLCAIVAFILTETFILVLGPYAMALLHVHRPAALRDRGDWISAQGEG